MYAAGDQSPKPTILNHDAAMKAVDRDTFDIYMAEEELDTMWVNIIYMQ